METYSLKIIPSDVSGSFKGIYNFFGQIGVLMVSIMTGFLYDMIGPSSIFVVVGSLDIVVAILTISLMMCGKIKGYV